MTEHFLTPEVLNYQSLLTAQQRYAGFLTKLERIDVPRSDLEKARALSVQALLRLVPVKVNEAHDGLEGADIVLKSLILVIEEKISAYKETMGMVH